METGSCWMMKMNSFSETCQMVHLACWHSATSEQFSNTGADQLGTDKYGSISANPSRLDLNRLDPTLLSSHRVHVLGQHMQFSI